MSQQDDLSSFSMFDLFRMEASTQCQVLTDGLLAHERGALDAAVLEETMRAAHSIKGAASIVGLNKAVELAHVMEDALVAAQQARLQLASDHIDLLLAGVDLIYEMSRLDEAAMDDWNARHAARLGGCIENLRRIMVGLPEMADFADPPITAAAAGGVRPAPMVELVPVQDTDRLLALASQSRVYARQLATLSSSMQRFKQQQGKLMQGLEQLHEAALRSGDAALAELSAQSLARAQPLKQFVSTFLADFDHHERRQQVVAGHLVDEVLTLRMRPFGDGIQAFPRMVRDLARSLGKDAVLHLVGEDTLIDRDILAAIESPLNHLLRNALDHGMESPDQRIAAGKDPVGRIELAAQHRGGMLCIDLRDDGAGLDIERIRAAVVARGLATEAMAAVMSSNELMEFLFLPAFSLKEKANEISGRGVGLDIVHAAIRQQNGSVKLTTAKGQGFHTAITLPLTQSIVRALVVQVAGEAYALPIAKVERVLKVARSDLHTLEGKQFFTFNGVHLGLVSAAQVLELGSESGDTAELAVVVVGGAARRYALVVDQIVGEQSLAVQALAPVFGTLHDIAAGALLADGSPVLILDVADLLLSIDKLLNEGSLQPLARRSNCAHLQVRRILVVDDSMTVREMERKLLAARGYQVEVAIDGIDGWNMVRSGGYDLVVTDVDMPRMDGIELVTLIRKDVQLNRLPILIVSYKDRADDRARGMAAGADYYLTKGSFHDESLLSAVHDLIGAAHP
jgi:two-component system sensor histidine kinase and response regulator WspE